MNNEDVARELQAVSDKADRNEGRIKKLEESYSILHELTTSVAVMASQMKTLNFNFSSLQKDVSEIKNKPSRRWDAVADKIIWALVAAVIAYALGGLGL